MVGDGAGSEVVETLLGNIDVGDNDVVFSYAVEVSLSADRLHKLHKSQIVKNPILLNMLLNYLGLLHI